jgi:hypothetical protein
VRGLRVARGSKKSPRPNPLPAKPGRGRRKGRDPSSWHSLEAFGGVQREFGASFRLPGRNCPHLSVSREISFLSTRRHSRRGRIWQVLAGSRERAILPSDGVAAFDRIRPLFERHRPIFIFFTTDPCSTAFFRRRSSQTLPASGKIRPTTLHPSPATRHPPLTRFRSPQPTLDNDRSERFHVFWRFPPGRQTRHRERFDTNWRAGIWRLL